MSTCPCREISQAYGGCIGQATACTVRCRHIDARGGKTCWEKTHARVDEIRASHSGEE